MNFKTKKFNRKAEAKFARVHRAGRSSEDQKKNRWSAGCMKRRVKESMVKLAVIKLAKRANKTETVKDIENERIKQKNRG